MDKQKLDHITIGDTKYPVYCDLRVLARIQERYETISRFERLLLGQQIVYDEDGNPERREDGTIVKTETESSVQAIVDGLLFMIQEGQRLEGVDENDMIAEDDLYSCIGNPLVLKYIVHAIFMKCFGSKKKEDKPITRKTKK